MRNRIAWIFAGVLALSLVAFNTVPSKEDKGSSSIAIGTKAPLSSLKMKDVSGSKVSIEDVKGEKGVLVIFTCNSCPFVVGGETSGEGWETRYNGLKGACDKLNIGMILVNSNEAKRDGDDSFEKMQERAKAKSYTAKYVVDSNHKLADAFGAKTTPHVFLFDKDLKLVYKGAIDDNNTDQKEVKERWLLSAISNMATGNKIDPSTTRNRGCSIKRVK